MLDADWAERAEAVEATDLLRADRATQKVPRCNAPSSQLGGGRTPPPAVLGQTDVDLPSQAAAAEAWGRWSPPRLARPRAPPRPAAPPDCRGRGLAVKRRAITPRASLNGWLSALRWLAALVTDYPKALATSTTRVGQLENAYVAATWSVDTLRQERLRPIVEQTLQIWSQLKQESNVSLEAIALTSRNTRRGVDIRAVVDDASGANALSVMSQGELNSLALAMYLPRATSDENPFWFLVLDDPVQAMDPTKVDGLATVLADPARTRQVIVFSHDDRLAHAAASAGGSAHDPGRPAGSQLEGDRPERDAPG